MSRLDESRANLKHHGIRPDESVIEEHRVSVKNFFEENTPIIFDTEFRDISLVNLVKRDETREGIEEAIEYLEESEFARSLGALTMTYEDLIEYYRTKSIQRGRGMFSRSPHFAPRVRGVGRDDYEEIGSAIEELHDQMSDSIEHLEEAITILSLNVDYNDYSRFTSTIPRTVYDMEDGSLESTKRPYLEELKTQRTSRRNVQWCVDFLVELAINLQEASR